MDHQRDSGWIEPLEATALSDDEEGEAQTPVSVEGDMNWTGPRFDFPFDIRRRVRGRTIMGVEGGVVGLPPELLRPERLTVVCPEILHEFRSSTLEIPACQN